MNILSKNDAYFRIVNDISFDYFQMWTSWFTFFKPSFSSPSDEPTLTKTEKFRGMKDSSSKEKSSRLRHDVSSSMDPVTPRTQKVSLDPTRPKQDLKSSETHEWVLPVSQRAHALVFEEPLFNLISITCKAPLQARDTVQNVTPFSFLESGPQM